MEKSEARKYLWDKHAIDVLDGLAGIYRRAEMAMDDTMLLGAAKTILPYVYPTLKSVEVRDAGLATPEEIDRTLAGFLEGLAQSVAPREKRDLIGAAPQAGTGEERELH